MEVAFDSPAAAELEGIEQAQFTDDNIEASLQFREDAVVGLRNPTFEDKQRSLQFLQVAVEVVDKKASVSCVVGGRDASRVLLKSAFQ